MKMNSLSAALPTCTQCGFNWVEVNRVYCKANNLCDVCANKQLGITYSVGGKIFDSRVDADAYRTQYKRKRAAKEVIVVPDTPPLPARAAVTTPPAVKKPIVVKGGKVVKQPCSWVKARNGRFVNCELGYGVTFTADGIEVIDLTKDDNLKCDFDAVKSVADQEIDEFNDQPYSGLSDEEDIDIV
jgi:hypothetical protein